MECSRVVRLLDRRDVVDDVFQGLFRSVLRHLAIRYEPCC